MAENDPRAPVTASEALRLRKPLEGADLLAEVHGVMDNLVRHAVPCVAQDYLVYVTTKRLRVGPATPDPPADADNSTSGKRENGKQAGAAKRSDRDRRFADRQAACRGALAHLETLYRVARLLAPPGSGPAAGPAAGAAGGPAPSAAFQRILDELEAQRAAIRQQPPCLGDYPEDGA